MTEPRYETQVASDGYPIHVAVWDAVGRAKGRVLALHGVQSHGGWYHSLGRTLSEAGYDVHFPDRRGSGANRDDRGHAPSSTRLLDDLGERLEMFRRSDAATPVAVAGISWGGKLATIAAARWPERVDALALLCPGLHPRVGVPGRERLKIAWAWLTDPRKTFPIPLSDPALFTESVEGRNFIATDRLGLHEGTAGLLAASVFIDRQVRRSLRRVRQPALLMLAEHDRIVDNAKTLESFEAMAGADRQLIEYPGAHHTLEFEPDRTRYALDLIAWLDRVLAPRH